MDWNLTEMQNAVVEAARPIVEGSTDPWAALVDAELLGVDGLLELCSLITTVAEAGGHAPVLETLVLGGAARATGRFAPDAVLTAAIAEHGAQDPRQSRVRAVDGRLWGQRVAVPSLPRASAVLVPTADALWCVDPNDATVEPAKATNGDAWGTLVLDGTPAERLGGVEAVQAWRLAAHVGISAHLLGLAKGALKLTAQYAGTRQQFGRPIGSFQAVSQRLADGWIDLQGMEASLWQAAWRLSEGLSAEREVLIARWQAAEGCHRIVATAQHVHGGFGFDRDYPLHRYFLTAKAWELQLGGPNAVLAELGALVAHAP